MKTMRTPTVLFALATLVFSATQAAQPARADDLTLTLTPGASAIRAMDPLFLKATLANGRAAPVTLRAPMGDRFGSIQLEIRGEGEAKFRRVRTKFSGLKGGEFAPTVIPPGGSFASHEALFVQAKNFVFGAPGTYELRATMKIGEGTVVSKPVALTVSAAPPDERQTLEASIAILNHAIGTDVSTLVDVGKLSEIEQSLSASRLKDTLQWVHAIRSLGSATNEAGRKTALETLKSLRQSMDPVTGEVADLVLAKYFIRTGKLAQAKVLLSKVADRTYDRDNLTRVVPLKPASP